MSADSPEAQVRAMLGDRIMHAEVARELFGEQGGLAPTIGRFVVLGEIGSGGMGRVYRAYDPELDRRIALKVLHPQARRNAEATARLRREAIGLAKLSHPNVVTVYEVGLQGQDVFIAMEYVEGEDLRRWALREPTPDRHAQALQLLLQAGRGLAAAHSVGLVHRDFKPSNVLVGNDGRIRVADFGLARTQLESGEPMVTTVGDSGSTITQTGTLLGTPRYMAPEQRVGDDVDARSDQYAFCVAAWEVLFGEHPAEEDDPPGASRVVLAALRRGLQDDPEQRFPSMDALLDALAPPTRPSTARWWLALAGVGVVLAAAFGVDELRERAAFDDCRDASTLPVAWTDASKSALDEALLATGVSHAETTASKLRTLLDDYVTASLGVRETVCRRTIVDGERSEDLLAAATECLDDGERTFTRLTDELTNAPTATYVHGAIEAAVALPDAERCDDERALFRRPALPRDAIALANLEQMREHIDAASVLIELGDFDDAQAQLDKAHEVSSDSDWLPIRARLSRQQAALAGQRGDYDRALTESEHAAFLAAMGDDAEQVLDAQLLRLQILVDNLQRYEEAARLAEVIDEVVSARGFEGTAQQASLWALECVVAFGTDAMAEAQARCNAALALQERLLGPSHAGLGGFLIALAGACLRAGDPRTARSHLERALEIDIASYGPDHPIVATVRGNLGTVALEAGELEEALHHFEAALAIRSATLAPDHPHIGMTLENLALPLGRMNRSREGIGHLERALGIAEHNFGAESLEVGNVLHNLGVMHAQLGEYKAADGYFRRSVALTEKRLGAQHSEVAVGLLNVGLLGLRGGDLEQAEDAMKRALAIFEAALGSKHPRVGHALTGLGDIERQRRHWAGAIDYYERAAAIHTESQGPDNFDLIYPLRGLGEVHVEQKEFDRAAQVLERSLELAEPKLPNNDEDLAELHFAMAKAQLGLGNRERALESARAALDVYTAAGSDNAELKAWLDTAERAGK